MSFIPKVFTFYLFDKSLQEENPPRHIVLLRYKIQYWFRAVFLKPLFFLLQGALIKNKEKLDMKFENIKFEFSNK